MDMYKFRIIGFFTALGRLDLAVAAVSRSAVAYLLALSAV